MATEFFHCISHNRVTLVKSGDPDKVSFKDLESGKTLTLSEEEFFNFYVPMDKVFWKDPTIKEPIVQATSAQKAIPWPPNQLRERRFSQGTADAGDPSEDLLPTVNIG